MPRTQTRAKYAFPAALLLTALLALLPWAWLGWLQEISDKVNLPLLPLRDGAGAVARWISPPDDRARLAEGETVEQLVGEREYWRQQAHQFELQAGDLQEQLAQIQALPREAFQTLTRPITARITGRQPSRPGAPVELNRGTRHGVHAGAVAVWGGAHLIGRVEEVSGLRSVLMPIATPAGETLLARVWPMQQPQRSVTETPLVHLSPQPGGTFVGEAAKGTVLVGDRLILADPAWPQYAHAMVVGEVESISPKDQQPLVEKLVVRPVYQVHGLARVTLVTEEEPPTGTVANGRGSS